MLEEQAQFDTNFFGGCSWIWILFGILLLFIICPFFCRPYPCPYPGY